MEVFFIVWLGMGCRGKGGGRKVIWRFGSNFVVFLIRSIVVYVERGGKWFDLGRRERRVNVFLRGWTCL